jgi:hypothetical protein
VQCMAGALITAMGGQLVSYRGANNVP